MSHFKTVQDGFFPKDQPTRTKRILVMLFLLLALGISSTAGFHLIEGWSWLESAYVVIITLSTVGHGTPSGLSPGGMGLMIALIIIGVGLAVYLSGLIVQGFLEGELGKFLGRIRMERQIQNLQDHYLICGFGRIGSLVCKELHNAGVPFVVVEKEEEPCHRAVAFGYVCVQGDATDENVLKEAGIDRAKGLVAVLGSDAENVFLTMSARFLNRNLSIVARASAEKAQRKLYRAGANRCISPESIGGRHMAKAVLKPNVLEFIDLATGEGDLNLDLDEIRVPEKSTLVGKTLMESGLRQSYGIIIVAIRKPDGVMRFNPSGDTGVDAGDVLLALGEKQKIKALRNSLVQRA